jgi:hypothetical protein
MGHLPAMAHHGTRMTSGHNQIAGAIQSSIRQLLALEKLVERAGPALDGWHCVSEGAGQSKMLQLFPAHDSEPHPNAAVAAKALSPGPWKRVPAQGTWGSCSWGAETSLPDWTLTVILHRPEPEPAEGEVRPSLVELRPDKAEVHTGRPWRGS